MLKRKNSKKKGHKQGKNYCSIVYPDERRVLDDFDNGSKALLPLMFNKRCKVLKTDDVNAIYREERKHACDYTVAEYDDNHGICAFVELKDTSRKDQITKGVSQIMDTIDIFEYPENSKYKNLIENRDYHIGVIVGSADKTLPKLNDKNTRELAKKLYDKSGKKPANMANLVFEVQPQNGLKKVKIKGNSGPYLIKCGLMSGAEVPFPTTFMDKII